MSTWTYLGWHFAIFFATQLLIHIDPLHAFVYFWIALVLMVALLVSWRVTNRR